MATVTARALQLLGLLQSRPVWTGPELAGRLRVTTRTVRRDVERLRELGYPVRASKGIAGGYQLGAGRALPPLLLDGDEAVAVAVCLRLAAGGTVAGVGEAAVRALTKLDQVLPLRLRAQVSAVQEATVTLLGTSEVVDPDALVCLARASRDRTRVRFGYVARDGSTTSRTVEPYQLVATDRRWYLFGFDVDREHWRTFRLDRMSDVAATTWTFRLRDAPDAREHVSRALTSSPYRHVARVRYAAPVEEVRRAVTPASAQVEPLDESSSLLTAGADHLDLLAVHLVGIGIECEVLGPPELREAMRALAARLGRAAGG